MKISYSQIQAILFICFGIMSGLVISTLISDVSLGDVFVLIIITFAVACIMEFTYICFGGWNKQPSAQKTKQRR